MTDHETVAAERCRKRLADGGDSGEGGDEG